MTTAAGQLETHLNRLWPSLRFQCCNCRFIAGTRTPTQHAWPGGNARDIFGSDMAASPESQETLDSVAAYLSGNRWRFGIKIILWRVSGHFNHIHVDMWPTGVPKPPCMGGNERYRYRDGRIVYAKGGVVNPEGTFPLSSEATVIVRRGESGPYVGVYQKALNVWAVKQSVPGWTPLVEDGAFGPATVFGVSRYQDASGIAAKVPEKGNLDDLTRDLLERFVES